MIHDQVKKLLSKGPASTNRYSALFSGGGGLDSRGGSAAGGTLGWANGLQSELRLLNEHSDILISNIQFPGRSIATGQMRGDRALGLTRKYAHSVMFNEFSMTFTLNATLDVHSIFTTWLESMTPRATGSNTLERRDVRIQYYNSYVDPKIILKKMERTGEVSLVTTVYNAFPLNVSDLNLSASGNNSTLEFTVNFAYETFENMYGGQSTLQRTSPTSADGMGADGNAWGDIDLGLDTGMMKFDPETNMFDPENQIVNNWDVAFGADQSEIDYASVIQLKNGQSNDATKKIVAEEKALANKGKSESPQRTGSDSFDLGDGATFTMF
ncbi:hypothetical protein SBM3_00045 [Synechococcus phage S-BM3]|nr:hypothetical protein SBM3_00045 [Synechococcus phage S-BM3]